MDIERRKILGSLAFGAGTLATARAFGAGDDGHAAGGEAEPSSAFVPTIPRKAGDAQAFSASLDSGPIKATSGGWARDLTAHQLPIATGISGAHLFLQPGGIREMHWHASAEWAYVIAGRCQATVLDPAGDMEVVSFGPGDTWFFPAGHAHAIQTIGHQPCHAILTFDDGLYGDHGTFGLSDWLSRLDGSALRSALGLPAAVSADLPKGEVYIMQGPILAEDRAARDEPPLEAARSHRYALSRAPAAVENASGMLRSAPAAAFPVSTTMTGFSQSLQPGCIHSPHWHPEANEWHFLLRGRTRVTLYEPEKRMAVAEMKPGDCAYLPRAAAHMVQNIGGEPCAFVGVHDAAAYRECSLSQWLAHAPRQVIAANLGLPESALESLGTEQVTFCAAT